MSDPVATPPSSRPNPVTLEDLLRLKRAEKPAPEFWSHFETELRAKQLAALVKRPPWWQRLVPTRATVLRLQVPLGAAAALAVGVIVWRSPETTPSAPPLATVPLVAEATPQASASSLPVAIATAPTASEATPAQPDDSAVQLAAAPALPATPWQVLGLAEPAGDTSPSARTIEANLVAARTVLPEMVEALGRADQPLSNSTRAQAMPAAHSDQAGAGHFGAQRSVAVASAGTTNSRAARLLAAVDFSEIEQSSSQPVRTASSAVRDRAIRRLSDDALYDSASRLGVGGDRLSISF